MEGVLHNEQTDTDDPSPTQSAMSDNERAALSELQSMVESLMEREECSHFCEPLNWRSLGWLDYPEVVETPMDLSTVLTQLKRNAFQDPYECAEAIKLVFNNCLLYSPEQSDLWVCAKRGRQRYYDVWREIRRCHLEDDKPKVEQKPLPLRRRSKPVQQLMHDPPPPPRPKKRVQTLDPRRAKLASRLLTLDGKVLRHVIKILWNECPAAVIRPDDNEGKLAIVVDHFSSHVTKLVSDIVDSNPQQGMPKRRAPKRKRESSRKKISTGTTGKGWSRKKRPVLEYDAQTGRLLNTFESLSAAGRHYCTFPATVSKWIEYSVDRSVNGKIWKYQSDDEGSSSEEESDALSSSEESESEEEPTPPPPKRNHRTARSSNDSTQPVRRGLPPIQVAECDAETGKVLRIHLSIRETARNVGADRHTIRRMLAGKGGPRNGVIFRPIKKGESVTSVNGSNAQPRPLSLKKRSKPRGQQSPLVLTAAATTDRNPVKRRSTNNSTAAAATNAVATPKVEKSVKRSGDVPYQFGRKSVQVAEIDKMGKILGVYPSMTAAGDKYGIDRKLVRKVVQGELPECRGRRWRLHGNEKALGVYRGNSSKVLGIYSTMTAAGNAHGIDRKMISKVIQGELDEWNGYRFKWDEKEALEKERNS